MENTEPRRPIDRPITVSQRFRTRLQTATSATQGWAERLKRRLEDARVVRTLGNHR